MAYVTGWQRIIHEDPWVRAAIYVDSIRREGNTLHYQLNAAFAVEKPSGFWDFPWYADMQVGDHVRNAMMVKGSTAWRNVIGGREWFISERNGHFVGSININGPETSIVGRLYFYDDKGHHGVNCYYNIPIPVATHPSPVSMTLSDVTSTGAKFKGDIFAKGDYSTIKKWRLEWQTNDKDKQKIDYDNEDVLTKSWELTNLKPNTRYIYRISVLNSANLWSYSEAVFVTKPSYIGDQVKTEGNKRLTGYVIYPNGTVKRINKIRKVVK